MSVSVVILNFNGKHYLEKFVPIVLESLSNVENAELVVADNASTDGSVDYMKMNFPKVKTIVFEENYGFAKGYNKALKLISTDYYVLLNSDVEVTADWLEHLVKYMEENPTVAACQPKIKSYHNRNYFEYAGAAGGYIDKYGYPFCRGRIFNTVEEDKGQYDEIKDIFWASGACMLVRSVDYWEAGALDEDFFAHMEEIDLCWRLKNRGRRIVCVPQSVVYHIGGGTLNAENPKKTYLNFRNNLLMLYKNVPHKSLKKTFDMRFWLDNIAGIMFLLKGNLKNTKAISDARTDFRKMKNDFCEKRKQNILASVSSTQNETSQNSIIYEYYIKRNKLFSQIKRTHEVVYFDEE